MFTPYVLACRRSSSATLDCPKKQRGFFTLEFTFRTPRPQVLHKICVFVRFFSDGTFKKLIFKKKNKIVIQEGFETLNILFILLFEELKTFRDKDQEIYCEVVE